jgi:hypothetical protein
MTDEEIKKAWHLVQRFGPSNNWTGTNGPLAAALGRALKELARLKEENNGRCTDMARGNGCQPCRCDAACEISSM